MKRSMRALALILAMVFAVYGFPMVPTSAEEDTGSVYVDGTAPNEDNISGDGEAVSPIEPIDDAEPQGEDLTDTSNMKFVQKAFDTDTGMLTMTLKVKATDSTSKDAEGNYAGTHLSDAYLAFSVDTNSVVPVTVKWEEVELASGERENKLVPDREIIAAQETIAFVGGDSNDSQMFQSFLNDSNTRGAQFNDSFNSAMGLGGDSAIYDDRYSALFTSTNRIAEEGILDCYLQVRLDGEKSTTPDEYGYIEVVDLYFQCYSTELEGGYQVSAGSDNELFGKSITLPKDAAEANELTAQFYTMKGDTSSPNLTMGAAGYVEKLMTLNAEGGYITTGYHPNYYYHFSNDRIEKIRSYATTADAKVEFWQSRATWNGGTRNAVLLSGSPYRYYTNWDKVYLITGFSIDTANTFAGQELEAGETPDFYTPSDERLAYPRYSVPTGKQNEENDKNGDWSPFSYVKPGSEGTPAQTKLKYLIQTTVSDNSETNPETEDLTRFLNSIEWEFALPDGTALNSYSTDEIPDTEKEITYYVDGAPVTGHVVEAYLDGGPYIVWNLYNAQNEYVMTTPVGVVFDMMQSDIVTYKREDGVSAPQEVRGIAPQLHVTNAAADVRSYLWNNTDTALNGQVLIKATYTSKLNEEFEVGTAMTTKLYKEQSEPTNIELIIDEIGTTTNDSGSTPGFELTKGDSLTPGKPLYAYVYDQYYTRVDSVFSDIKINTTENIPDGKADALTVVQDTENKNKYYITYGKDADGLTYNVSEAVQGNYAITATCQKAEPAVKNIFIKRETDKLSYLEIISSRGTPATLNGKDVVYVPVPALDGNGNARTESLDINISVLANQWYDAADTRGASRYDIAYDIRTGSFVDLDAAADGGVAISIDGKYADSTPEYKKVGVDAQNLGEGTLYYNTKVYDDVQYDITVSATHNGITLQKELAIIFTHNDLYLERVEMTVPATVTVPTSGSTTATLTAVPRDQYGQTWLWDDIYREYGPGGTWNINGTEYPGVWTVELVDGTLPSDSSITMSGENNNIITVSSAAKAVDLKVKSVFTAPKVNGGNDVVYESVPYTIKIMREESKPRSVEVAYSVGTFIPGIKSDSGTANDWVYSPTSIVVKDQYGAVMSPSDYTLAFSAAPSVETDMVYLTEAGATDGSIMIKECAPSCSLTLYVEVKGKNGGSCQSTYNYNVTRDPETVKKIEIVENFVKYPTTSESTNYYVQLSAKGETQYGSGEVLTSSAATWTLVSVTVGGTKYTGTDMTGTGLNFDGATGRVSFASGVRDPALVPTAFEVKAASTGNGDINITKTIEVRRDASVATSLDIPQTYYKDGITVPAITDPDATLPLAGTVRDQYGLDMTAESANIKWTITSLDPTDNSGKVTINANTGTITVTSAAVDGFADIKATYTDANGKETSQEITVSVKKSQLAPAHITFRDVKDSKGSTLTLTETKDGNDIITSTECEVPLPSMTDGSATYTIRARVLDQYNQNLSAETVTWSIDPINGNETGSTINSDGVLTVNYSQTARDMGESTITVIATSSKDGSVMGELTVTVKKQEDVATYAVPQYVIDNTDRIDNGKAVVPQRNETATTVTYTAVVYSQYGAPMSGVDAEMQLVTTASGIELSSTTSNSAKLSIHSYMSGEIVDVRAFVKGSTFTTDKSTVRLEISRGELYPFELLLEKSETENGNPPAGQRLSVPSWDTNGVENESSDITYYEYTFYARVATQYGGDSSIAYPVWEIAQETDASGNSANPPAIMFADGQDFKDAAKTQVRGKTVKVLVGSTALSPAELTKVINLNVWTEEQATGDRDFADAAYKKTLSFTLSRSAATPNYLYFSSVDDRNAVIAPDVDANGDALFTFDRPTAAKVSAVYTIAPRVFDGYGFQLTEEPVQMDLVYGTMPGFDTGYQIVTTYASGESEKNGDIPATYTIWKLPASEDGTPTPTVVGTASKVPTGSVLMASFNTKTRELTLYNTCTITQFNFSAYAETVTPAANASKSMVVQMSETPREATSLEIVRGHSGSYSIKKNATEPITEEISAVIYDQYGERYAGSDVVVDWKLNLPDADEDGELDEYKEYEEDGVTEKMAGDYLILLSSPNSPGTAKTMTIQPEQFVDPLTVILTCEIRKRNSTVGMGITATSSIVTRRASTNSNAYVSLYFEAGGEFGKLIGPSMISVPASEMPESIPGVKTVEGYGFIGWTSDGVTLVDPLYMPALEDVVYYAVYKDVTENKFIDGYKNKTVRPGDLITRAEYVKMVVEANFTEFDVNGVYESSFTDVEPDKWYAKYIGFAQSEGIIDGYEDHTFRPENHITRAEAVKILADAFAAESADKLSDFTDVDRSRWYAVYIDTLYSMGVIDGYPDGTFKPNSNITRAEAAKLIVSLTDNALSDLAKRNIVENAYCPFTDIRKTHWAYAYILRAAGVA